jgi:hypothetical protein
VKLPNKPVEFRRHPEEHFPNDVDHFAVLSVNGTSAPGTGREKKLAVPGRKDEAYRDALFRCGYRERIL